MITIITRPGKDDIWIKSIGSEGSECEIHLNLEEAHKLLEELPKVLLSASSVRVEEVKARLAEVVQRAPGSEEANAVIEELERVENLYEIYEDLAECPPYY
jgi:hypothetical protein